MIPLFGGGLSLSGGAGGDSGPATSGTGAGSAGSAAGVNSQIQTTTTRIYGGTGSSASAASKQDGTLSASPDVKSDATANGSGDSSVLVYAALAIGVVALVVAAIKK